MKQRVSFARALVVEPLLLFLDEPFSALYISLKKELYSILIKKCKKMSRDNEFIYKNMLKLADEFKNPNYAIEISKAYLYLCLRGVNF